MKKEWSEAIGNAQNENNATIVKLKLEIASLKRRNEGKETISKLKEREIIKLRKEMKHLRNESEETVGKLKAQSASLKRENEGIGSKLKDLIGTERPEERITNYKITQRNGTFTKLRGNARNK
eukprot:75923_1